MIPPLLKFYHQTTNFQHGDLHNLIDWATLNDMQLNTAKTKEMILGPVARANLPLRLLLLLLLGLLLLQQQHAATDRNDVTAAAL